MSLFSKARELSSEIQSEASLELMRNASSYKKAINGSMAIGIITGVLGTMSSAFASGTTIADFGTNISDVISSIYQAVFPVFTVIAALLLVIAFIMRMTANQQKAAQATSWIVRFIICYICVNCIGIVFSVIKNTTSKYTASAVFASKLK